LRAKPQRVPRRRLGDCGPRNGRSRTHPSPWWAKIRRDRRNPAAIIGQSVKFERFCVTSSRTSRSRSFAFSRAEVYRFPPARHRDTGRSPTATSIGSEGFSASRCRNPYPPESSKPAYAGSKALLKGWSARFGPPRWCALGEDPGCKPRPTNGWWSWRRHTAPSSTMVSSPSCRSRPRRVLGSALSSGISNTAPPWARATCEIPNGDETPG